MALTIFFGLTDFYRHFVRNYASLTSPIIDLLKIDNFTRPLQVDDVKNMLGSRKGKFTLRNSNSGLESPDIKPKGPDIFLISQVC